jgi:hypothetical protein
MLEERLLCSLFITLLVGGIHKSEISNVVAFLSNRIRQAGTSLELLVRFCCLGINMFTITRTIIVIIIIIIV